MAMLTDVIVLIESVYTSQKNRLIIVKFILLNIDSPYIGSQNRYRIIIINFLIEQTYN